MTATPRPRALTNAQVARRNAEIRRLHAAGKLPRRHIGERYGLSYASVNAILGPSLPIRFKALRTPEQARSLAEMLGRHRFYDKLYPPFPILAVPRPAPQAPVVHGEFVTAERVRSRSAATL